MLIFLYPEFNDSLKNHNKTNSQIFSFLMCVLCCCFSHVQLFPIPWTVTCQAPLSMGILQARTLEWVPMPSSRGSSQPRNQTQVLHIADGFLTIWAIRKAQEHWVVYPCPSPGDLPTQESNWSLLHCRWILYHLSYQWNPWTELNSTIKTAYTRVKWNLYLWCKSDLTDAN